MSACGASPSVVCRNVLSWTGTAWLAELADWVVGRPLKIVVIAVAAVVVSAVARRFVRRLVVGVGAVRERTPIGRPQDAERAALRTATLSHVLRSAVAGVVWTVAVIAIVAELGVNLGAFIATATVVGGAIAFGAQTVVRDFLAGLFVVAEDQYGVGDDVDLGLAAGTVEKVSLRATRLRDPEGRVWHVPHGAVERVANRSQEWARVLVDVPVDLGVDPADAGTAIVAEAETALAPFRAAGSVLAPPDVLGVEAVLDDRTVLRLVVRVRPVACEEVLRALRAGLLVAAQQGRVPLAGEVKTSQR